MMFRRRRREQAIRECLATFPEQIAYPSQVAARLNQPYRRIVADMRRMAHHGRGIHNLGQSRTIEVRA